MIRKTGLLEKIGVIKDAPMIARFTLKTARRSYNCILVKPELVTVLLMLQEGKYTLAVAGDFNKKKQLVVTSFTVQNPDKVAKKLGF